MLGHSSCLSSTNMIPKLEVVLLCFVVSTFNLSKYCHLNDLSLMSLDLCHHFLDSPSPLPKDQVSKHCHHKTSSPNAILFSLWLPPKNSIRQCQKEEHIYNIDLMIIILQRFNSQISWFVPKFLLEGFSLAHLKGKNNFLKINKKHH